MRMMNRGAGLIPALSWIVLGLAASGCGNLTVGGIGEATVTMSGDAPESGSSPQAAVVSDPAASPASGPALQPTVTAHEPASEPSSTSGLGADSWGPLPSDDDDNDPEGQLEADVTVYLVGEDGQTTLVSDGEIQVRIDLLGLEEPVIASRRVEARTYAALRLVFTEIHVEVDQGLIIDGQPLVGPVDVEFDGVLPVEKPLALDIAEGERADILVDLNADSWLLAVDPLTLTVDAQVFADFVTVLVR